MTEPTVCAIMLTRDRPELAKRAVECFRKQTYENKRLLIWDTSGAPVTYSHMLPENEWLVEDVPDYSIGELRNRAASWALNVEVLVHWDDDDWSHPNRITEQVAFLQASGADCVGYNEMLFARSNAGMGQEAWLYSYSVPKPTLGTSLCYWRKTWERKPFNLKLPNNSQSTGEDWDFIQGLKVAAIGAIGEVFQRWKNAPGFHNALYLSERNPDMADLWAPRMIARIHGANFTKYNIEESNGSWKRVPEWDNRVREILK
jgi:glycosyltransferase involved in cell wall biosynthesis